MRRLLPSPGSLIALLALLVALGPGVPAMFQADGDVGRHVRVGREILTRGEIPRVDSLSHTRPGGAWVPKEWASQVAMAAADEAAGLAGVAALAALAFAAAVALTYHIGRAGGAGVGSALAAATLALLLMLVHLLPRPHLATTTLLALETWLLVRARRSGSLGPLLALPPLFALWANLHGGFPIGIVVLGVFVADAWIGRLRGEVATRSAVRLTVIAALSVGATLLNPVGPALWGHISTHLGNQFFMSITQEFRSPDFRQPYGRLFLLAILSAAILVGWRRPIILRHEGALFLLGLAAALSSARHITVFAVIAVPWIGVWATRAIEAATDSSVRASRLADGGRRLAVNEARTGPFFAVLVAGCAVLLALGPFGDRARFDSTQFPIAALEAVPPEGLPPEMFNQMRWGGYILYAYPEIRIFMDGHADYFGEELTREYLGIRHLAPGWEEGLDRYGVNWTLTMPMAPISQALTLSPEWRRVYEDGTAVIYVRTPAR